MRIVWHRIIILVILFAAAICELSAIAALIADRADLALALMSGGVVPSMLAVSVVAVIEGWVRR